MNEDSDEVRRLRQENAVLRDALDRAWKGVVAYPFPQVCKHLVASNMLTDLEGIGFGVPDWVSQAVVHADDAAALTFDRATHGENGPLLHDLSGPLGNADF